MEAAVQEAGGAYESAASKYEAVLASLLQRPGAMGKEPPFDPSVAEFLLTRLLTCLRHVADHEKVVAW